MKVTTFRKMQTVAFMDGITCVATELCVHSRAPDVGTALFVLSKLSSRMNNGYFPSITLEAKLLLCCAHCLSFSAASVCFQA